MMVYTYNPCHRNGEIGDDLGALANQPRITGDFQVNENHTAPYQKGGGNNS